MLKQVKLKSDLPIQIGFHKYETASSFTLVDNLKIGDRITLLKKTESGFQEFCGVVIKITEKKISFHVEQENKTVFIYLSFLSTHEGSEETYAPYFVVSPEYKIKTKFEN